MEYGICLLPAISLRKEPNDRSETLTEILFGETVRVFEVKQSWYSVETDLDKYPGWLDAKQVEIIPGNLYQHIQKAPVFLTDDPVSNIKDDAGTTFLIPACSTMPGLKDGKFTIDKKTYHFTGKARRFTPGNIEGALISAQSYLNAPYLWGGRTIMGIDCSGLVQNIFRLNGINLPRDARQQAEIGEPVSLLSEARPGDLAFFDNAEGIIVHVGIIFNEHSIIHASGRVRRDLLDHHGIYDSEKKQYTHKLRLIRRVV